MHFPYSRLFQFLLLLNLDGCPCHQVAPLHDKWLNESDTVSTHHLGGKSRCIQSTGAEALVAVPEDWGHTWCSYKFSVQRLKKVTCVWYLRGVVVGQLKSPHKEERRASPQKHTSLKKQRTFWGDNWYH